MRTLVFIFVVAGLIAVSDKSASAQLNASSVIFDDFEYTDVDWCNELTDTSCSNPGVGSVYGHNTWHTNTSKSTTTSRLWYRYLWQEQTNQYDSTSTSVDSGNSGHV